MCCASLTSSSQSSTSKSPSNCASFTSCDLNCSFVWAVARSVASIQTELATWLLKRMGTQWFRADAADWSYKALHERNAHVSFIIPGTIVSATLPSETSWRNSELLITFRNSPSETVGESIAIANFLPMFLAYRWASRTSKCVLFSPTDFAYSSISMLTSSADFGGAWTLVTGAPGSCCVSAKS